MPALDTHDRKELEDSLAHWKRELAHAKQAELTGPQAARAAAAKLEQEAHATIARRDKQIAALPGPRRLAITYALTQVGVTEVNGSNTGPQVSKYQKHFGVNGEPWCGAFVGYCAEVHGGADLTARILYTPYILQDAERGVNGLSHVVWTRQHGFTGPKVAHTFDLVLFDFGTGSIEHVEALRAPWKGSGQFRDVGGNTSFADGSQNDGGAVALKLRDPSQAVAIVSIAWPKSLAIWPAPRGG